MKYIRFPTMSMAEFLSCIEKYPHLLSREEYFDIFYYISTNRQLTIARRFPTQVRKAVNNVSIKFEPYHSPYAASFDQFYFKICVTKKYSIKINSSSISLRCNIFSGNSLIYTFVNEEPNEDSNSFSLPKAITFEADRIYRIKLDQFECTTAQFCLKYKGQAEKYPFILYGSGYRGSIISKIEFKEVLD